MRFQELFIINIIIIIVDIIIIIITFINIILIIIFLLLDSLKTKVVRDSLLTS